MRPIFTILTSLGLKTPAKVANITNNSCLLNRRKFYLHLKKTFHSKKRVNKSLLRSCEKRIQFECQIEFRILMHACFFEIYLS